jgi:hypothetical protein
VREQARAELQAFAETNGYSFSHWLDTGRWLRYDELETVSVAVSALGETVKQNRKVSGVETVEMLNTRLETVVLDETVSVQGTETVCVNCKLAFRATRKTKRFCSIKCKNDFHNQNR